MAEQTNDIKVNKRPLRTLLNYQWIVKNIPFFLFLSLLAILYIANGHRADRTVRKIDSTTKELKDLQFEYKTLKADLMFRTEEIQISKAAEPLGLKTSKDIPTRIK